MKLLASLILLTHAASPARAAASATVTLTSGQSVILCTSAQYGIDAAKDLSSELVAGRQQLKVETSSGEAIVNAPYAVSAPAIGSADGENDTACVTITKQ